MDSGTMLSYTPHIIESLFKNLSALDLCKCARVNKLWNHLSTAEINRLKQPIHFYQALKCSYHKKDHPIIKECSMRNAGRFEDELDLLVRNLEVRPAFCIAFANWTLWENFESLFPSHPTSKPKSKRFKKEFDDSSRQNCLESVTKTALKKRLPRNCQVALYFGRSLVDTQSDPEKVNEHKQVPALSGYFFPELSQQGIRFCKRRNSDREVFKTINTRNDMKSVLVLMEHKTIGYLAFGLKQILKTFNVFENGIVFPVQIGSNIVPLFYGSNLETTCVNIPISNDKDSRTAHEMERRGAFGLVSGKTYDVSMKACKKFHEDYPLIPIAGLFSFNESEFESTDEEDFYYKLIRSNLNLDFECKCMLISIKY